MTTDRPLTLDVTDFGPIARACVELRPLTVFVGPSNSGKSWLATQAYALHRYFGVEHWGFDLWFRMGLEAPALPEGATTDLVRFAEQLTPSRGAEPTSGGLALTGPILRGIHRACPRAARLAPGRACVLTDLHAECTAMPRPLNSQERQQ